MRIVETRTVREDVASGDFDCPSCRRTRPYRHVRARRVARAYGIRLFPVGGPVDVLECRACRATFDAVSLEREAGRCGPIVASDQQGMLHVMVATARSLGRAVQPRTYADVYLGLSGMRLDPDELDAALQEAEERRAPIWRYLHDLEPHLNDVGKERVVHAALFLAAPDGRLERFGARHVCKVARALGVPQRRLKGMVVGLSA